MWLRLPMLLATMRSSMRGMMMVPSDQTRGRRVVSSSPGVPLRATPTRSALRVDADTQESVVELLVPVSSVVKLAICRRIARSTPLRVHLVRLIRSQLHRVAFSLSLRIMLLRPQIISALQARTLLSHGCEGFLATIHDTTSDVSSIHDQPIVSKFPDVFPDELLGIPPVHEVEFSIELIPRAEPISKAPYRMAPIELKELKDQLQELLKRGFIRLSVSPWGCTNFIC
nr:putative reverse transcriptase domain, aspartic peptidase domain protein [Tanacetum cinerariifolium]